jgi:hypothetical protein
VSDEVAQHPQHGGGRVMGGARSHRARHATRAAAALVLAVVAAAVLPAAAQAMRASTQIALLERYQPVTRFSSGELFTPTNVGSFVQDSHLLWQSSAGTFTVNAPGSTAPTPASIGALQNTQCEAGLRTPCWMLNETGCSASAGVGAATLACYQNRWQATAPGRVVYGRVVTGTAGVALQYWYFYYLNPFQPHVVSSNGAAFWEEHEGDWQAVTVILDPALRPVRVGYALHCLGLRRSWAATPKIGTHPVAHIARGSHAAWFGRGFVRIPRAADCLTPAENAQLDSAGITIYDTVARNGDVSGPPGLAALGTYTPTTLSLISGRVQPAWLAYPGTWGEQAYINVTVNGTVVRSGPHGYSPLGPPRQGALWSHPFATVAGWPKTFADAP